MDPLTSTIWAYLYQSQYTVTVVACRHRIIQRVHRTLGKAFLFFFFFGILRDFPLPVFGNGLRCCCWCGCQTVGQSLSQFGFLAYNFTMCTAVFLLLFSFFPAFLLSLLGWLICLWFDLWTGSGRSHSMPLAGNKSKSVVYCLNVKLCINLTIQLSAFFILSHSITISICVSVILWSNFVFKTLP